MEADSTSPGFIKNFHSWHSAETLSNADEALYVCAICKVKDTEFGVREKKEEAEANNRSIFFVESQCLSVVIR